MKTLEKILLLGRMSLVLLAAGCTARAYSGPALPPSEISTVSLHRVGEVSIEEMVFDGHDIPSMSDSIELAQGDHEFRLHYRIEEQGDCDKDDWFCLPTVSTGICEGRMTTLPGRTYLLTLENRYSLIDARVAAKGYYDFSERSDEPSPGSAACRTVSTY